MTDKIVIEVVPPMSPSERDHRLAEIGFSPVRTVSLAEAMALYPDANWAEIMKDWVGTPGV